MLPSPSSQMPGAMRFLRMSRPADFTLPLSDICVQVSNLFWRHGRSISNQGKQHGFNARGQPFVGVGVVEWLQWRKSAGQNLLQGAVLNENAGRAIERVPETLTTVDGNRSARGQRGVEGAGHPAPYARRVAQIAVEIIVGQPRDQGRRIKPFMGYLNLKARTSLR